MQKQLEEQIKPIKDYEGLYSISNYGYVISEAKEWECGTGRVCKKDKTILNSGISDNGYAVMVLYNNGKKKNLAMHRLVWDCFGDSPRNNRKLQVDHIDENKQNNRIDNLQLLTNRENSTKYRKTQKYTSEYIGVCWDKHSQKWVSRIRANGKNNLLGYFKNEYDAHLAYQKALNDII